MPTRTSFVGDGTTGDEGVTFWVLAFTEVVECEWSVPDWVSEADVLVVAGGGGGGANVGGGGGAGGMVELSALPLAGVSTVTVRVGAGGAGATHTAGGAQSGGDSNFGATVAVGGGRGASAVNIQKAESGGSGGGGSETSGDYAGALGTAGQGNAGGAAASNGQPHPAGGGGGAAGAGATGTSSRAGDGGAGRASSITGTSLLYAGGGGGGWHGTSSSRGTGLAGSGGVGGGGAGGDNVDGSNGAPNSGGGGGGTGRDATLSSTSGGAGGSGIVIVRVRSVATDLEVVTEPVSDVPAGDLLLTQPVVRVLDGFGALFTGATVVSVSIGSGAGGTLGGTTTVSTVAGVATFTDLTLAGDPDVDYVLRFSAPEVADAASQTLRVLPVPEGSSATGGEVSGQEGGAGSVDGPSPAAAVAAGLTTSCAPLPLRVGGVVSCTVAGGDARSSILWEVATDRPLVTGVVTLDVHGMGTFGFEVPAGVLGRELTVRLVGSTAPQSIGVVSGPLPTSVPSGEGRRLLVPVAGPALALLGLVSLGLVRRMRVAELTTGRHHGSGRSG